MPRVVLLVAGGDACLVKPHSSADLLRSVEIVAGIVFNGTALPLFPRGFKALPPAAAAPHAVLPQEAIVPRAVA
jgi:hypothetical protein